MVGDRRTASLAGHDIGGEMERRCDHTWRRRPSGPPFGASVDNNQMIETETRTSKEAGAGLHAWAIVALLWVVALLNYLDRQIIFSVFPLLKADLRLSDAELGLLGSAFLWVYALLSPISGFLADRFGRVRLIIVSLLVWSLVTWLTGYAR